MPTGSIAVQSRLRRPTAISRQPRKLSSTGFYHIVFRGVNHCHLFEETADYAMLLGALKEIKDDLVLKVVAYCLMSNHVHLLIAETRPGDIITAMRRLLVRYACWFNRKYQRSGALIANRYKSEVVEDDGYLLALVRYIHQNPVVSGMARHAADYRWSSYGEYVGDRTPLVEVSVILDVLSPDGRAAISEFEDMHLVIDSTDHSLPDRVIRSDEQVRDEMVALLGGIEPFSVGALGKEQRDAVLSMLRKRGFSIRQIERITGVPRGVVSRVPVAGT
jgi:REP element-mobilizing transposase RayT